MRAVRVTVPIYVEITTPADDRLEGYERAREFLNEQYRLMRSMRGSAHLSAEFGDEVRLWCPEKDEVQVEMTELPDDSEEESDDTRTSDTEAPLGACVPPILSLVR